jgi:large subunit ribosomal protein L36
MICPTAAACAGTAVPETATTAAVRRDPKARLRMAAGSAGTAGDLRRATKRNREIPVVHPALLPSRQAIRKAGAERGNVMKVRNSLRSLKSKPGSVVTRRRGRQVVINKKNPRWNGRQG